MFAYFVAPPKFLDALRMSYAQTLEFDLRLNQMVGDPLLMTMAAGDVLIKGRAAQEPIVAALSQLPGRVFRRYEVNREVFCGREIYISSDCVTDPIGRVSFLLG